MRLEILGKSSNQTSLQEMKVNKQVVKSQNLEKMSNKVKI